MKKIIALLVLGATLATAQEVRRAIPVEATMSAGADDLARFLAGRSTSAFSNLQTGYYESHAAGLNTLWQRYYDRYFVKMREWNAAVLRPMGLTGRTVFYFFGGPDALAPLALFPDAPVYILGGLEPVGSIASPASLMEPAVMTGLDNLRKSTEVILSYGHFITKDMKADLDRTDFKGVLPIITAFLSLSGCEVISTNYISIQPGGKMQEMGSTFSGSGFPGVKIIFRQPGAEQTQTLYYVQANLSDDAVKSRPAVLEWAGGFGKGVVYLKSASYLMHETYFSRIRNFLTDHAVAVVQDDSGIPYKFFRDKGWRCWLFGQYDGTLDIFKKYYQPDLQGDYAARGGSTLPFGTGYKWRQGQSNLLIAMPPTR